ncbi:transporter [Candidatus Jorgensenbacteria bacterium RIFCSPLOWO2_01_FULL_45_25b]|uniref:Transporter n=1 Tax=Candidatus Jorgensenbacteria bacterium RIFCSPLOWO2_01_FULL_45_25b TaxID=1798471 RepID=A0A1F6BXK1_9BACT|nr:MAG: transporter [Candidatus Jorgensenbacteria bacterium RIFCSPLOWO2_01_FULL_45_25b]
MALFKINGSAIKKLTAKELDLEKHLQELFENNLEEILNIVFLAHEYSTSFGGRIDTLGIDKNGSPCIIEYKKNQNDNVINQGLSYLRWLLDHKADFEILCQSKKINIEIDWDSPRVICVAENYNKFDLDTADILPINIELLRYRIYDENILYLEPENYQKVRISTSGIIRKSKQEKDKQEILQKNYSVDDHINKANENIKSMFLNLREKITALDEDIIEEPKAKYIAYKTSTNFTDIVVKQYGLKIFLNVKSGQLNDPQNLARDLAKPKPIGHWGNGDYEVKLEKESELDAVFGLIKQSYDLNK